jgi:methylenetetrahydrofolate reductase (NADPH)
MGIEPILQLTCRDKNRIALQGELMGAAALGVRNLLLLTGDDPKAGDQPDTKPVFDVDSKTLLETARRLRDDGTLPTGRKVGGRAAFFLGAADVPIDPPADWQPNALIGKARSGAQFVQTQFCMDAAIVRRYVGRLAQAGLTQKLAILIGVNPLRSAKSAAWMKSHLFGTIIPDTMIKRIEDAAVPEREGVAICADLIEDLSAIPGVAGVHIMAPGNDAAIPEVIAAVNGRIKALHARGQ